MIYTICEICNKKISNSNIDRHVHHSIEKNKIFVDENWLDLDTKKYKCPECGLLYSKQGICSHIIISHTKEGKERHFKALEKAHESVKGKRSWNSGLTKDSDERILKGCNTLSKKYESGEYKSGFIEYQKNREKFLESARQGGLISADSQNKRSKNEKLFCEMCEFYFKNVKHNERIFNGWDADIIIEDFKIVVLWNGIWHYKQISKKQSLEQVQSRDKIKLKEIETCGYKAYIIKDMGKYNPIFVKDEFDKFLGVVLDGIEDQSYKLAH